MITMVVPTRNRAHTLQQVVPSYFQQQGVSEIVFVIDAGTDDTVSVIRAVAQQFPHVLTKIVRNTTRLGASQSRNLGVAQATNAFILFCDDDEHLEPGYAQTCLRKLLDSDSGAVSGRRVYMLEHESVDEAVRRFGNGMRNAKPFRPLLCEYVNGAKFDGDIRLPFTNAVIVTHRSLVRRYPFDPHYARGNGYREETDYQMNLFTHGYPILVTNDVHSIHLHASQIRRGGQVVPRWSRICWSVHYTRYFYRKYYRAYAARLGLRLPCWAAIAAFAVFAVYREYLRPAIYVPVMRVVRWRCGRRTLAQRQAVAP